jgi:signal transduction histidine kinase
MPQDSSRDRIRRMAQPAVSSGSLPPKPPDDRFATSNTSDISRDRLNAECRRLRDHIQELSSHLDNSTALMSQRSEVYTQAEQVVRDIERDSMQFNRAVIIKAYQDWSQAKVNLASYQDMRDQLKAELENDRRCLEALEMALLAVADAAFFSDDRRLVPIETGEHHAPHADRRDSDNRADEWDDDEWNDSRRNAWDARRHDSRDIDEWDDDTAARDRSASREEPSLHMTSAQLVEQEALLTAREYERHALARGIDERVRYALTDAVLQAEFCEAAIKSDPSHAGEVAAELKTRLSEILRETDMLIFELEPMMLSELGLAGTLHRYVNDLRTSRGAPLVACVLGKERRYHVAIERAVFRAAREGILNALRHSRASHVVIALAYYDDAMILSVEDDGIGFDVDEVMARARRGFHSGFGQLCIEADVIGATLGLKSAPTLGTRMDYIITDAPGWLG